MDAGDTSPRHVYVHVPFCARRCSYCDFAIAVRRVVPVDDYLDAIRREISIRFPASGAGSVDTLYLGGGTPSRLGADGIRRLLDTLLARFAPATDAEITIEANPDDVTSADARAWKSAGITRVSLGAQSFSDAALRWMHRTHDALAIGRAVGALRDAGLHDVSLDLIFALPESVPREWGSDIDSALALEPTHISLYGLTVEPTAALGRWRARGEVTEATEDRYEGDYLLADRRLREAGFEHYEVSNFGLPGRRARHNSAYWRHVPYAALGPGAHEFDGSIRRWNAREYSVWKARLLAGGDPKEGEEALTPDNRVAEEVYLGLRTTAGLPLSRSEVARVQPWIAAGWGTVDEEGRLVLTPLGWLRLDSLAADLTRFRSRS